LEVTLSSRRPRRRSAAAVPNLHFVMILAALIVTVLGGVGYLVAAAEKASFFQIMSFSALTFLFGKLSNSFGKPVIPAGALVPVHDGDPEDQGAEENQ
jgi:hypothetical protein